MYTFLLVAHIAITVVLVGVVLVQQGKGGGLGAGFGGGGANTLFGSSGGSNFFTKLTMVLAAGFMAASLGLTALKTKELKTSIFDQSHQVPPATEAPPSQPTAVPPAQPGAAPLAEPGKEAPKK